MSDDSSNPNPPEQSSALSELAKAFGKKPLLSWGTAGAALFLAVHFAQREQWTPAAFCFVGAGLLAIFDKLYKKLEPELDKLFQWLVNNFVAWVKKHWWKITANFKGKYYQQLIFDCRDYRTQGLKTKGAFTLDLEKVFVPLQLAPESAQNISSDMIRQKIVERCLGIWDLLAEMPKQPSYQRIAIIAPPGAGKTTLLEHLTLTYARQTQRRAHRKAPNLIPVLVYLRTVREEVAVDKPPTLATVIENRSEIEALNPKGWFENQLKQGKCLVLLDGLDEVADEDQRRKVSRWVDLQMQKYPKSCFILTSRPFGYEQAALTRVGTVLEVQSFSLKQMQQFIENWYLQNELNSRLGKDDDGVRQVATKKANDLITRIKDSPPLTTMAINPLLLTMIATVHCYRGALPGRRVELYSEICDVLLGRRQDAKGIPDSLTAVQKRSVLKVLALALMQRNTREFSPQLGCALIGEALRGMVGDSMQPAKFLEAISNQTGLLIERENSLYEFSHKSFQEYLAAVEVQEDLLIQKVNEDWWAETIRLYVSQSDATRLIQSAQADGSVKALTLAFECLEEGLSIQPEVRNALENQLQEGLESTDPELFHLAAEVKLSRRLNQLVRIDDEREIDTDYITCAEYQLFIDAKRKEGIQRQLDHWGTNHFAPGDAHKPITGVRAKDAEEFCQWLSERQNEQYRLPENSEALEHPSSNLDVGSWCMGKEHKHLEVSASEKIQTWQANFSRIIARNNVSDFDIDIARTLASALDSARVIDLDLDRVIEIARNRNRNRASEVALNLNRASEVARTRTRALTLNLDFARTLNRDRTIDSALVIASTRARDLSSALALTLDRDRTIVSARACAHDLSSAIARAIAIVSARDRAARNRDLDLAIVSDLDLDLDRAITRDPIIARDLGLAIDLNRALDRDLAIVSDLDLDLDRVRILDHVLDLDLNYVLDDDRNKIAMSLRQIRSKILLLLTFWNLLSKAYGKISKGWQVINFQERKSRQKLSLYYESLSNAALKIYSFFILIELRNKSAIDAVESIRIVREKR